MNQSNKTYSIMVDWGTSNLRAYLVAPDGVLCGQLSAALGVKKIAPQSCPAVLNEMIKDWRVQFQIGQILMGGMVGSEIGWRTVPLVATPCGIQTLAENAVVVDMPNGVTAKIMPGVLAQSDGQPQGIMRGEEIQALGGLDLTGSKNGLFCLPGSHSKWVGVRDREIQSISTFMTGELFYLMSTQSVLHECVTPPAGDLDYDVFVKGVELARSDASLMELMFTLRTEFVIDPKMTREQRYSKLSGIIIGAELLAALNGSAERQLTSVTLVGDGQIARGYALAFECFDQRFTHVSTSEAFLAGCRMFLQSSLEMK